MMTEDGGAKKKGTGHPGQELKVEWKMPTHSLMEQHDSRTFGRRNEGGKRQKNAETTEGDEGANDPAKTPPQHDYVKCPLEWGFKAARITSSAKEEASRGDTTDRRVSEGPRA